MYKVQDYSQQRCSLYYVCEIAYVDNTCRTASFN